MFSESLTLTSSLQTEQSGLPFLNQKRPQLPATSKRRVTMKSKFRLNHAVVLAVLLVVVLAGAAFPQVPGSGGQQQPPPSTKGAVIKGRAPVSKEILRVKLPKLYETKLSNGLQVMVLENHKLPNFN